MPQDKNKKSPLYEQQPLPHDLRTERIVIGTMIMSNDTIAEVEGTLTEDCFYHDDEREMYNAIRGLSGKVEYIDIPAVMDYARTHKMERVTEEGLLNCIAAAEPKTIRQNAERLRTMADKRNTWALLMEAAQQALDPIEDNAGVIAEAITQLGEVQQAGKDKGLATFRQALDELKQIIDDKTADKRSALKAGFRLFDEKYILRPSTLTVIAAFTSVGKTSLAMNVAVNVAMQGHPVAYYSLEMGKVELAARIVASETNIPAYKLLNEETRLDGRQLASFEAAYDKMKDMPLYIDERATVSFDKTVRSIRNAAATKKIELAVIDYLQIYSQASENVEAELANMARMAKNIARETDTAIILLSQLNRSDSHPSIKMLRGSGQIEEAADNIILIDRPEAYPDNKVKSYIGEFSKESIQGTAKLILAKGRGVGTGADLVNFDSDFTTFSDRYHGGEQEEQQEQLPF